MAVAASIAGSGLTVEELRVRYLILDGGGYRIIDRSNRVVDGGHYLLNEELTPATIELVGDTGQNAGRTIAAIYELAGDELSLCYDLEGRERPAVMQAASDEGLVLRITYARAALRLS